VLVIPGRVVGIDLGDAKIGAHWTTLQKIFGQSDQCLEIDDPLTAVLDRVHARAAAADGFERYAVARLASTGIENSLKKSLAGYRARRKGDDKWLDERIQAAASFYKDQAAESKEQLAEHQVSSKLGVPLAVVTRLSPEIKDDGTMTVTQWTDWFFEWISKNPDLFDQMFRPATIDDLLGGAINRVVDAKERAGIALPLLTKLTRLWLRGRPLSELQLAFGTSADKLKTCVDARKFVLRVVPELAYLFGIPAFLIQNRLAVEGGPPKDLTASLAKLGACLRFGFESVELLALGYYMRTQKLSRREVHEQFESVSPYLKAAPNGERWERAVDRVEDAIIAELNRRAT
jgi:antiviral helicase SKI2